MRLTRFVKAQIVAFTLISLGALGFTAFVYGDLGSKLGLTDYPISAQFSDASGLYPRATVAYRGVTIGSVSSIDPTIGGATVHMRLKDGTSVPANVIASIHSTSAIGEQYIDLVPPGPANDTLHSGSVIANSRTRTMPQIGPVLDKVNALLANVPQQSLASTLNQLDTGFTGTGQNIGTVIDQSSQLVTAAYARINQTRDLVAALSPVLATQAKLAPQTQSYFASLASLTGQLADSTPNLEGILRNGPAALASTGQLTSALQPVLPGLLGNLHNALAPVADYRANLVQSLAAYPALLSQVESALTPHASTGLVNLNLTTNVGTPASCIDGYVPVGSRRSPSITATRPVDGTAHCSIGANGPEGVRGLRNDPCPNSAQRSASPAECGLVYPGAVGSVAPSSASDVTSNFMSATTAGSPATAGPTSSGGVSSWLALLLGPLGL